MRGSSSRGRRVAPPTNTPLPPHNPPPTPPPNTPLPQARYLSEELKEARKELAICRRRGVEAARVARRASAARQEIVGRFKNEKPAREYPLGKLPPPPPLTPPLPPLPLPPPSPP